MSTYSDLFFTSTDGLRLYARDYPAAAGPARLPVVCIHGLTRNSADFEDIAPWLAGRGRRVLAVDVRGRGRSAYDPVVRRYHPMNYAGDVLKLAHDLGIARAVFVGTSMGGLVILTLALRRLPLIAAAVLNDAGPTVSLRALTRIADYAGRPVHVASWAEATAHVRGLHGAAFPELPADEWLRWARRAFEEAAPGEFVQRYDLAIAAPFRAGKLRNTAWIARYAFRRLARARPTLLIRGGTSEVIEPEHVAWMRAAAPRLQVAEVPGVGHAPTLMEPAAQAALRRFLEQVD
jgi:pimeloyl-ACP methyl ester carboxylesterase